jgi:hypothetical protein
MARRRKNIVVDVFEEEKSEEKKDVVRVDLLKGDVVTKNYTYFPFAAIMNMWKEFPLKKRLPCTKENSKLNSKDIFFAQKQKSLFVDEKSKVLYLLLPKEVAALVPGHSALPKMFVESSHEKSLPKKKGDERQQRMMVITRFTLEEVVFNKDHVNTFPEIKSTI